MMVPEEAIKKAARKAARAGLSANLVRLPKGRLGGLPAEERRIAEEVLRVREAIIGIPGHRIIHDSVRNPDIERGAFSKTFHEVTVGLPPGGEESLASSLGLKAGKHRVTLPECKVPHRFRRESLSMHLLSQPNKVRSDRTLRWVLTNIFHSDRLPETSVDRLNRVLESKERD